jgi:FkbM family methyltransferase
VVDGLTVLSPNDAARQFGASALFLVTIWNDSHRFAETAERLTRLGCRYVTASPPLRWKYAGEIATFPLLFLDLPSKVHESVADVMRTTQLWEDDQSRREYVAQIRLQLLGDVLSVSTPLPNQYQPNGIFLPDEQEVFVDCGAFDGDTVRSFIESWRDCFRFIYAFEPDPTSFGKLADFVKALPARTASRIEVMQAAIGGKPGHVRFRADGTMGAAVAEDGDIIVACRTLDELFERETVTYVKMDIEGEELRALQGARSLISRCRPVLAICVYHKPDHVWSIPLYLQRELRDYAFFLRRYKPDGWDLILYAVPRERTTLGRHRPA